MSDKRMMLSSKNRISVIIATRNRAKALKNISLRSLARQTYRDFEVIVWDASDDDLSQKVVMGFKGKNQSIDIKFFRAPRKGLASQRNDAVNIALGEIVFFIDDDSEVSPEGLDSVLKEFDDSQVFGVGLSLKSMGVNNDSEKYSLFRKVYCNIFKLYNRYASFRKIYPSGWNGMNSLFDHPGEAQWLSGCSMACRKEIFNRFNFEERLEKFGGYAFGEDVQFSSRLFMNGMKMVIAENGYVIHHWVAGDWLDDKSKVAARIYNHFIMWKTVMFKHSKISILNFTWSLIGEIIYQFSMSLYSRNTERIKGIKMGLKAILNSSNSKV